MSLLCFYLWVAPAIRFCNNTRCSSARHDCLFFGIFRSSVSTAAIDFWRWCEWQAYSRKICTTLSARCSIRTLRRHWKSLQKISRWCLLFGKTNPIFLSSSQLFKDQTTPGLRSFEIKIILRSTRCWLWKFELFRAWRRRRRREKKFERSKRRTTNGSYCALRKKKKEIGHLTFYKAVEGEIITYRQTKFISSSPQRFNSVW